MRACIAYDLGELNGRGLGAHVLHGVDQIPPLVTCVAEVRNGIEVVACRADLFECFPPIPGGQFTRARRGFQHWIYKRQRKERCGSEAFAHTSPLRSIPRAPDLWMTSVT